MEYQEYQKKKFLKKIVQKTEAQNKASLDLEKRTHRIQAEYGKVVEALKPMERQLRSFLTAEELELLLLKSDDELNAMTFSREVLARIRKPK